MMAMSLMIKLMRLRSIVATLESIYNGLTNVDYIRPFK